MGIYIYYDFRTKTFIRALFANTIVDKKKKKKRMVYSQRIGGIRQEQFNDIKTFMCLKWNDIHFSF